MTAEAINPADIRNWAHVNRDVEPTEKDMMIEMVSMIGVVEMKEIMKMIGVA